MFPATAEPTPTIPLPDPSSDLQMLKLAREIAMDIRPIEDILESLKISAAHYEYVSSLHSFQDYLRKSIEEWQSALNTSERVRVKSLAFVEESLPEFFARAHDPRESLSAKIEVLKTVAKFGGMGGPVDGSVSGERMVVTINLGADHTLRVEKDITPTLTAEEDRL